MFQVTVRHRRIVCKGSYCHYKSSIGNVVFHKFIRISNKTVFRSIPSASKNTGPVRYKKFGKSASVLSRWAGKCRRVRKIDENEIFVEASALKNCLVETH